MDDPEKLLDKYNAGLCTEEEKAAVESWYLKLSSTEVEGLDRASAARTKSIVWSSLTANEPVVKTYHLRYWAAASAIFFIGIAGYFYLRPTTTEQQLVAHQSKNNTIVPGSNKAFLTLADGRKISLTDANSGEIVKQGDYQSIKLLMEKSFIQLLTREKVLVKRK